MINLQKLEKLIGNPNETYKVNKTLIKIIGAEEALLYTYLLTVYIENNYKFNEQTSYFYCPVEKIQQELGFSAFKQRNILSNLVKRKLISIKLGQSRTRYILINEDLSILENLLYTNKYQYYQTILINKFMNSLEELKEKENLSYEDSIQLYNFVSHISFDRSLKKSDKFKNFTYFLQSNNSEVPNDTDNEPHLSEEVLVK